MDARDVFFEALYERIKNDSLAFLITVDMGAFAMTKIEKDFPRQFLNIGVREPLAMSFAAGMALEGHYPFVYGITSFLVRRAYEQIYIDIGLHNLPVTIVSTGFGKTYVNDGPTHQCEEDMDLMSHIPNMETVHPQSADSLRSWALQAVSHPVYMRLPKGEVS